MATPPEKQRFIADLAVRYGGRLRRFLTRHSADASEVSDLSQEVFMRLLRVADHEDIRSPEAYLFTIASHVVRQHAQKQARQPETYEISEVFTELELLAGHDPAATVDVELRMKALERVLDELPAPVAMALLLQRFCGFSVKEVARELDVAQITVKKYLSRALLHCRERGL